ncbi:MAG: alanine--tRNA ligase [Anaerolineales bacterium]|nr:alanine--tRNA ligase [Anaerolineales bacterium]
MSTSLKIKKMTSAEIRQSFLEFMASKGHTIVPSMSLVPGGDQTLLFTNSGMVQFKDVFLGTGKRPYTRAADSQKCMRVAGKHNDLDDVGRDDTHHTFFEMLGNWSFGDYYKEEAIAWAWELLTDIWGFPKDAIWATCFEDEFGQIPRDDEAADIWRKMPGFVPEHLLFFGREENFWEMAETGPSGPDSEIFLDRGLDHCNLRDVPGHECHVNGDCQRFLELWNLVFIQYNRTGPDDLSPLPAKHVDTGMGFERLVSVIQDVNSNYRTDLFIPLMETIRGLAGHSEDQKEQNLTPYRVIADHARASAFLIADGVVPGNTGRNYVCRMIIRRASRFGSMIGLNQPFLAEVAQTVIDQYGDHYSELKRNQAAILQTITQEEDRFHRTIDAGLEMLSGIIEDSLESGVISGTDSFDLYATYGLPLEITRDAAREEGLSVDEAGFQAAMEEHRIASSSDEKAADLDQEEVDLYRELLKELKDTGVLGETGVEYDPYGAFELSSKVHAIVRQGQEIEQAQPGDRVAIVAGRTPFYVEAGGQVSDTGTIHSTNGSTWKVQIEDTRQPVEGLIVHVGQVVEGSLRVGDEAHLMLNRDRRLDIMRNHTATHLLHEALRRTLGDHVRQAGSLVAPDRLRFDFTHPAAMTKTELESVEEWVNREILANHELIIDHKPRQDAIAEGAMALFGETYGEIVRTIQIGTQARISFELCGGTHVPNTSVIGQFILLNESSVASGIRRIEALTGRAAIRYVQRRLAQLDNVAEVLDVDVNAIETRVASMLETISALRSEVSKVKKETASSTFDQLEPEIVEGVPVLTGIIPDGNAETLRELSDRFRANHDTSAVVLATIAENKPLIIAALSDDLVERGLHAGELVKAAARIMGGGGGGKPSLGQAGGKDPEKLSEALAMVPAWIREHLNPL